MHYAHSLTDAFRPPRLRSVLHPTGLSEASRPAFAHALAISLLAQARLTVLYVGRHPGRRQAPFPNVRSTLERWGLLAPHSPRSAVYDEFKVRVSKVAMAGANPRGAILEHLEKHPAELVVFGTEARERMRRLRHGSVATSVARRVGSISLFVPADAQGFVSPDTGRISMRRILVPVASTPRPTAALGLAAQAARILGDEPVRIDVLHVGDGRDEPRLVLPAGKRWHWRRARHTGDVVEGVLGVAREGNADLVVMMTEGREGVLDALRGSTTEQIVRRAPCPVAALPAGWPEGDAESQRDEPR